ncbi:amidohydrolase [Variovorax sp. OV084]|jgi:2-pyrone-4,6-dicarboxylate lactonase|uniref:amidohydrolase family protein n=1 Tax=Variovorax sp. OV084 TaxID=1882777 RepID=UPI0008AF10B5|nr:amidohydrolase family protein [Variovorax sp. OV084]SET84759.1 2-pyrone-4,6-dicarboxylate lactonase [Variovorax sp. OV084]
MTFPLPPGACNAHCHVFGPGARFPYAPDAASIPETDAPKEALYALNDRLGLQRCVVVQSTCHGFDNRAAEDAVASRPSSYRAISLLPTDVDDSELERLHAAGFRGVRFNFMGHLGRHADMEGILSLAGRFAPLGWHLQIHGDPALLTDLAPALRRSPTPVVIDHIGRIDAALGLDQPDFQALLRLMADERFWVKVSGMDRITRLGPPYADAQPFARTLVAEFGDRVVWGNDWPHPNHAGPIPDEQQLVDLIAEIAPTESARHALLVGNPERLYQFGDRP